MQKNCLFIDDDDDGISSTMETLVEKARLKGIDIECAFFNPHSKCQKTNHDLDLGKIAKEITPLVRKRADVVAVDYNLSDKNVFGTDIANIVRQQNGLCTLLIYSGNIDHVVKRLSVDLKKARQGSKEYDQIVQKIRKLVSNKIAMFVERTDCSDIIIGILRNDNLSIDFLEQLDNYKDLVITHGYPEFHGKTLGEIRKIVERQTAKGIEFRNELISRCIAHLVDLNKP